MQEQIFSPLNEDNYKKLSDEAIRLIYYINQLKDTTGKCILQTQRKTGFLGTIINLTNIFELYRSLQVCNLKYLLTFKLSQDFLETFFSAIRVRGGWNNNPNALQFEASYKRLLLRHDIWDFENTNFISDNVPILNISSKYKQETLQEADSAIPYNDYIRHFDHDYIKTL